MGDRITPFAYINSAKLAHGVSLFGDTDQKKPQKTLEEAGTPEENQEEPGSSQEAGTPEEPEAAQKPELQKNLNQPEAGTPEESLLPVDEEQGTSSSRRLIPSLQTLEPTLYDG